MGDVKTNLVWTLKDNVSPGVAKMKGNLEGLGVKSKGVGGMLDKLSVSTGGLVTPTSLAMSGALALAGGLKIATDAAIADEESPEPSQGIPVGQHPCVGRQHRCHRSQHHRGPEARVQ